VPHEGRSNSTKETAFLPALKEMGRKAASHFLGHRVLALCFAAKKPLAQIPTLRKMGIFKIRSFKVCLMPAARQGLTCPQGIQKRKKDSAKNEFCFFHGEIWREVARRVSSFAN
jgi:hypothetical protein